MRHTLGWSSRMARPASRRSRSTELLSVASLGDSTLIATSCPVATSRARSPSALPQLLLDLVARVQALPRERGGTFEPEFRFRGRAGGGAGGGGGGHRRLRLHFDQHVAVAGAKARGIGVHRAALGAAPLAHWRTRSEERRVGKECRSRWSP